MDYSPPPKPSDSDSITDELLLDHFVNHARNDNLGRIAMLWMDHAVKEKNAGCDACLELAKLASIAVDFPKSSVPAEIPDKLILSRSTPRAHWRERKGSPSFHCDSIVGQLYDRIIDEMKSQAQGHKRGAQQWQADTVTTMGKYFPLGMGKRLLTLRLVSMIHGYQNALGITEMTLMHCFLTLRRNSVSCTRAS